MAASSHHRSRFGTEPDDPPFDLDPLDDLRPLDDPTWRERLDDLMETIRGGPLRTIGPILALAVLAGLGWWLLRPPSAPPIEAALPLVDVSAATPTGSDADPVTDDPAPAAAATETTEEVELVIAVAGAIDRPGVHRLPAGSRVDDAIRIAGGMTADADPDRLNLAAPLTDGERIWVPSRGEEEPPEVITGAVPPPASAPDGRGADPDPDRVATVDINTADATELEALPGVGPATAAAIVAHREENGPFATVDQLIDVRGIGEVKLEQIRPHATL